MTHFLNDAFSLSIVFVSYTDATLSVPGDEDVSIALRLATIMV